MPLFCYFELNRISNANCRYKITRTGCVKGYCYFWNGALRQHCFWWLIAAWMYHAQVPPPSHQFDPTRAGITWVDLVFPFFLVLYGSGYAAFVSTTVGAWHFSITLDDGGRKKIFSASIFCSLLATYESLGA